MSNSENEKAFKSVSLLSAGSMLNALLGFMFLTGVAKALPLAEFGKYALLTSLLTLSSRIMDFGTNSLYVSDTKKDSTFIVTKIFLFFIALPVSVFALYLLKLSGAAIAFIFTLGLVAYGINYSFYAFYQKEQKYLEIVALNGIPALVKGIFGILLILGYTTLNLPQSFGIFTLSIFVGGVITLFSPVRFILKAFNLVETISYLKKAVSPGISLLIQESWQTANNVITKVFNTFGDVGVFSMANKISNIFQLLSISVFTVLLPKNAQRKKANKAYDFHEMGILAVAMFILAVLAIVAANLFINIIFEGKFDQSIQFLNLLIFASAIMAVQSFAESYFYVQQKTEYLLRINLAKLFTLVAGALIAIPAIGLIGLAWVNFAAAVVGLGLTFYIITWMEKVST